MPAAARPVVVLVNVGTPDEPTVPAVRRYLREFLRDRRVVEMHPLLWWPVLEGAVLTRRPKVSARKYAEIWTEQGSPLAVHTTAQAVALDDALGRSADVVPAMRYGNPHLREVVQSLADQGRHRILVVPLYPQFAGASTGTVLDELHRVLAGRRDSTELRTVRSFAVHEGYLDAVCTALSRRWEEVGRPDAAAGDRVVLSFHSVQQAVLDAGDPYQREVEATAAGIRARLGLGSDVCLLTYQSRFGTDRWVGPATIDTLEGLGRAGCRRLEVVCPGFVSDCLETIEEIEGENREAYEAAGGNGFAYVPWGNSSPEWAGALADLVRTHLAGWVDAPASPGAAAAPRDRAA